MAWTLIKNKQVLDCICNYVSVYENETRNVYMFITRSF